MSMIKTIKNILSNRKILFSLLVIGLVTSLAVGATIAYYADREESNDNTFVAGEIDLQIDNTSYYNGALSPLNTWNKANLDDGQGPNLGKYLFFSFNDLKPGDWGEDTISLHVMDNDSWVCGDVTLTANDENTVTSGENRLNDTSEKGELADEINFIWWADDGDNVYEDNETIINQANLGDAPLNIPVPVVFADSTKNIWNSQGGPMTLNHGVYYIGKAWCFGEMTLAPRPAGNNSPLGPVENSGILCNNDPVSNISQSDSAKLDVAFYAVQSQHEESFVCPSLKYGVNVTKQGSGAGTVVSDISGINCGPTCSSEFLRTAVVTLTASPLGSSTFSGWGGDCSGLGSCVLTIDKAYSITANFSAPVPLTLNVTLQGGGSGTVTSIPAGINCGTTCSANYTNGTTVTLSAAPGPTSTFAGWSGACVGTGACIVLLDASKSVTANFNSNNSTLTVSRSGTGNGTVSSSPAGINCGGTCSATWPTGTSVVLNAVSDDNSTFAGWSGACAGTGSCAVTLDTAKNVNATFFLRTFNLDVIRTGGGSVSSNPSGINCGSTCSASFNAGSIVTLTATPDIGANFAGWNGACTGTSTCTMTMNSYKNVGATFTYPVTISRSGSGSGTVTSNPSGISCGATCSYNFQGGSTVTLTAVPSGGSTFTGWSGACSGTGACSVVVNSARNVTATFN